MFRRLKPPDAATMHFDFEGERVPAQPGDTVTAALLGAGHVACRETPRTGTARGPYCAMGVCFECLLQIDGRANVQGCQTLVQDGMRVRRQRGKVVVDDSLWPARSTETPG